MYTTAMTWQIYVLMSVLLFSTNSVLHRVLMKDVKSDPFAQTLIFYGLGGILALTIALMRGSFRYTISPVQIPYFLVLGIFCTVAPILAFKAYKSIEASEATILFSSQRLWMVVGAFFVLGEIFSWRKLFATLVILCGIAIAVWRKNQKIIFNQAAFYALLAAFSYAVADIASYFILKDFDVPSLSVFICFIPVIFLLIFKPGKIKKLKYYLRPKYAVSIIIVTINDTLASLAGYFAYQVGHNAATISPLMATQIILSVLLAIIFLKERDYALYKIGGAVIVVLGVMLLL